MASLGAAMMGWLLMVGVGAEVGVISDAASGVGWVC